MRTHIPLLALMLAAAPAAASVSGFYDSAAQIAAITENALVADALHQLPIEALARARVHDDGRTDWTVQTQRCITTVQLAPRRSTGIGPVRWELRSIAPCAVPPSAP